MKISFLKSVIFFSFSLVPAILAANEFNILSYGSAKGTMSAETVLMIENIVNESNLKFKIVGQDKGLAYRKNSLYLLTKMKRPDAKLNSLMSLAKNESQFEYFETSLAIMVVSPNAPPAFTDSIKRKKSQLIQFDGVNRYWDDLTWGSIKGGYFIDDEDAETPFYELNKPEWNMDKFWQFAFFVTYELNYKDIRFQVTVLPKSFGGLPRLLSVFKNEQPKAPLFLGTGNIIPSPDDSAEDQDVLEKISKAGEHVIAAGSSEIIAFEKRIEPYKKKFSRQAPVQFVSVNIFKTENGKLEPIFAPYILKEKDGIKIALIGVTSPSEGVAIQKLATDASKPLEIKVVDPAPLLKNQILPEVHKKADLTVIITNTTFEEYAKMFPDLNGVDLVFTKNQSSYIGNWRSDSEFRKYKMRAPYLPLKEIAGGDLFVNRVNIQIDNTNLKLNQKNAVLDQSITSEGDFVKDYEKFSGIFNGEDTVLPDHKRIYPDKIIISKEEFANLASELMRREFKAEVGVFKIQEQGSKVVGEQDASVVKTWVKTNESIEVVYLEGSVLTELIQQNKTAEFPNKLAFSGFDDKQRIAGLSIRSNELYRVVLSSEISSDKAIFGMLKNAKNIKDKFIKADEGYNEDPNGKKLLVGDLLVNALRRFWVVNQELPESQRVGAYRNLYEGKAGRSEEAYWINEIKRLQIEYSRLTTTDTSAFRNVSDSRLQAADQKYTAAYLSYLATYRKHPFANEIGFKTQYAKQELFPNSSTAVKNILSDDILLFGNIGIPTLPLSDYLWFATEMGPYVEVAYNTEFERDAGLELKKILQSSFGWKFLNGDFFKSTTVSMFSEKRFTSGSERNLLGASIKIEAKKNLYEGRAVYRSDLEYRHYLTDDDTKNADLRSRFVWDQYFDFNVYEKISFGPYLKYFSLARRSLDETAEQVMVGVNLNFSNMWKQK